VKLGTRLTSSGVATWAGALLVAAGVVLVRLSSLIRETVGTSRPGRYLYLFYDSSNRFLRHLPEDFAVALAILAAGCALLTIGMASKASLGFPEKDPPRGDRHIRSDAVVIVFFPFSSILLFGFLSWRDWIGKPFALPAFAVVAALSIFLVYRRDRRSGARLGFSLTRTETAGLIAGTLAVLALYSHGSNSWKYSYIGDEWAFYSLAARLAASPLGEIPWLSAHGVYGHFPIATSAWQSLPMRVLSGPANASWRFS